MKITNRSRPKIELYGGTPESIFKKSLKADLTLVLCFLFLKSDSYPPKVFFVFASMIFLQK